MLGITITNSVYRFVKKLIFTCKPLGGGSRYVSYIDVNKFCTNGKIPFLTVCGHFWSDMFLWSLVTRGFRGEGQTLQRLKGIGPNHPPWYNYSIWLIFRHQLYKIPKSLSKTVKSNKGEVWVKSMWNQGQIRVKRSLPLFQ